MMIQEVGNNKIEIAEHAFVSRMQGRDVLFIKAEGENPSAYVLPEKFLERLRQGLKDESEPKAKFSLGQQFITPGAAEALGKACQEAQEFVSRHQSGDWGEVCSEDAQENDFSLKEGFRLLSAYRTNLGEKLWVITEADRSATTVLLPSEY